MAAAVLAGIDNMNDLARELRISGKTLSRTLSGKREITAVELDQLPRLLNVPEWFLREGLDHGGEVQRGDADPDVLARRHDELVGRFDDLAEMLRVLMARVGDVRSPRE